MAEGKGFTRTGPETTTKLLTKGEGFRTKHAGGLNANGDEMMCCQQVCILGRFCCSACSATNPGPLEAKAMCEGARVSGHVASHTSTRPQLQGMIDAPSGRLPSERHKPVGSRWAGIPAADKYLWMRLLMRDEGDGLDSYGS